MCEGCISKLVNVGLLERLVAIGRVGVFADMVCVAHRGANGGESLARTPRDRWIVRTRAVTMRRLERVRFFLPARARTTASKCSGSISINAERKTQENRT